MCKMIHLMTGISQSGRRGSRRRCAWTAINARIASTEPSRPFGAPAGLGGPGGADGIEQVRLALSAPVLAVGAAHLHHPHTRGCDVTGQAGAVAAGPFDRPGTPSRTRPASPADVRTRPGVAGNSPTPSSPLMGIERAGDVHVGAGAHTAGDGACLYDGQRHPSQGWRDGTHPLAAGPGNPGLFARPGRSRRQRGWVPEKPGPGRQIVSQRQPERVSGFGGQARTRPPTLCPARPKQGKQGRSTIHILPADSELVGRWLVSYDAGGQIHQFGASPALPADRPYLASAMHSQRQLTASM
jgi:hypothetical protein